MCAQGPALVTDPPGAGEHRMKKLRVVDEKTDEGGGYWRISNCCHFTGGLIVSFNSRHSLVLHPAYCCI